MKEEREKASEILKDLRKGKLDDSDWKPSDGCQPSDRW